ncbi:LamB/YcsF family protein, partial [Lysinibacillus sphaericus]
DSLNREFNLIITIYFVRIYKVLTSAKEVLSVQSQKIKIVAHTLCIHGDGPHALDFAKKIAALRQQLH